MKTYADILVESIMGTTPEYTPRYREVPVYDKNGTLIGFNNVTPFSSHAAEVLRHNDIDFTKQYMNQGGTLTYFNLGPNNIATFSPDLETISLLTRPDSYQPLNEMEAPADFDSWFGGSAATEPNGAPMVFYHGVPHVYAGFDRFSDHPMGHFFTSDPDYAQRYAEKPINDDEEDDTGAIYPVYLSLKNPLVINPEDKDGVGDYSHHKHTAEDIRAGGYDGTMIRYADGEVEAMVIDADQIVSAVSARKPTNPSPMSRG
jgi:hypothetical protein